MRLGARMTGQARMGPLESGAKEVEPEVSGNGPIVETTRGWGMGEGGEGMEVGERGVGYTRTLITPSLPTQAPSMFLPLLFGPRQKTLCHHCRS